MKRIIRAVRRRPLRLPLVFLLLFGCMYSTGAFAQAQKPYLRIARIVVDSSQLEVYKAALKEGVEAAVRKEPGVISLYAVYDEERPAHITVFEIYASKDAYQQHIKAAHFIKYKTATQAMVKSLELTDVASIALAAKTKK